MSPNPAPDKCAECPALSDDECLVDRMVKLSNLRPGQKGTIRQVCGDPDFRLRMMEMGFVRGTEVQVIKYAPLSDPIELVVKGYHITLRRDQASDIIMEQSEIAA